MKELEKIDLTAVEELAALKGQRRMLAERLEILDNDKGVSKVVRKRIQVDYQQRRQEVRDQMAPQLEKAALEYAKLGKLARAAEKAAEAIRLDREELEVRNRLGEFTEPEYRERISEVDARTAAQEKKGNAVEEVRRQFIDALESPEDLAAIGADATAFDDTADDEAIADEAAADEAASGKAASGKAASGKAASGKAVSGKATSGKAASARKAPTKPAPAKPAPAKPAPAKPAPAKPAPAEPAPAEPAPAEPAPAKPAPAKPAPAKPAAAAPNLKTRLLTPGRLEPLDTEGAEPLTLEPFTSIGRTSDNQVQISEPEVSRHHAEILREDEGFLLRDLGSQNGTYVNGEPIKQCTLTEGDRIQIGTARFLFHAS